MVKIVNAVFQVLVQLWLIFLFGQVLFPFELLGATSHLTISMGGQRATCKIQRNNYHHRNCGPSFTGKTSSVYLIFTHGTYRNVKTR